MENAVGSVFSIVDDRHVLLQEQRAAYKRNILLSCLSKQSLQTLLNMGLTAAEMNNVEIIIQKLTDRSNSGRNRLVFRRLIVQRVQRQGEWVDNWLCDLGELAQKCNFATDCCKACETTHNFGQVIHGV